MTYHIIFGKTRIHEELKKKCETYKVEMEAGGTSAECIIFSQKALIYTFGCAKTIPVVNSRLMLLNFSVCFQGCNKTEPEILEDHVQL